MRHLHGHEPMQTPRHLVTVAGIGVYQRAHAPDARDQQLGILVHRNGIDNHATDAKVLECGLVTVEFFVKRDLHLVDNLVSAFIRVGWEATPNATSQPWLISALLITVKQPIQGIHLSNPPRGLPGVHHPA